MAEGAVSFLLADMQKFIVEQTEMLFGVQNQVRSLRNELEWISSFLQFADTNSHRNPLLNIWVNQVRDVAYDAEDAIDMFLLNIERQRQRNIFSKGIHIFSYVTALHKTGKKIEELKARTSEISANKGKYMEELSSSKTGTSTSTRMEGKTSTYRTNMETSSCGSGGTSADRTSTAPSSRSGGASAGRTSMEPWPMCGRYMVIEKVKLVKFEDHEKRIVSHLTEGEKRCTVISIVGMGGLGKTALAEKVYRRGDVKDHFDCHAWVCISRNYKPRNIFRIIIKRMKICSSEEVERMKRMSSADMGKKLHKYLRKKTFLVVLDDVWCPNAWDVLKWAFPDQMNGSRILLTSRREDVASHTDARKVSYRLGFLSEEESWELFRSMVFREDMGSCFWPNLEDVGREIAGKCDGLPLALIILGGLLFNNTKTKHPSEWADLLTNISRQLSEGKNKISTIFDLSYMDLPYNLKSCFLYCSLFPLEIPAEKLVQLWVAEGLAVDKWRQAEEEAEDNLEELVSRSMIQVIKRGPDGRVKTCRVHQILRELSILESRESKFLNIHTMNCSVSPTEARRLAIHSHVGQYISQKHSTPYTRSLLCFTPERERLQKSEMKLFFKGFKLVRVIDLESVLISELPHEIGNLIHIRFLGLRNTFICKLPSSISSLRYMETLDLRSVSMYVLQNVTQKMLGLRHLYVDQGGKFDNFKIGSNRNLRILSMVEAGSWISDDLGKSSDMIKLGVSGDLNRKGEALNDAVDKFHKLRSLELKANSNIPLKPFTNHLHLHKMTLHGQLKKLLQPFEFPLSLSKLTLSNSELDQDPMPVLEELPNLRILKLHKRSYVGKRMLCLAGLFQKLEVMDLSDLPELEQWELQEGAMQNLRCLFINGCLNLRMLPEGLCFIGSLSELNLKNMPTEFKQKLQENGEDWHKVQHISVRTIEYTVSFC